jgi:hypothetical protein
VVGKYCRFDKWPSKEMLAYFSVKVLIGRGKQWNRLSNPFFESTVDTGFRPGSRGPFVSTKGPKTIDAPSGLIGFDGRRQYMKANQLAALKQDPPSDESVRP